MIGVIRIVFRLPTSDTKTAAPAVVVNQAFAGIIMAVTGLVIGCAAAYAASGLIRSLLWV